MQRKKVINLQVLFEIICLIIFAFLLDHLIVSGKYQYYVTPKMIPYFYFTEIVIFIWVEAGIFRLFKPQYKFRLFHCYILIIPILVLILPSDPINSSELASRYGVEIFVLNDSPHTHSHDELIEITGLDDINRTIMIKDEEWSGWFHELTFNGENYIGYKMVLKGFVFKDLVKMRDDEFIICRLQMSCCASDLTPIGIIAKYDRANDLEDNQWVQLEGVLSFDDKNRLYINASNISPAEKPEDEYIYPI